MTETKSGTPKRLLSYLDVARMTGSSVRTVQRAAAEGRMPKPFKFGKRTVKFDFNEIDTWIAAKCPPNASLE